MICKHCKVTIIKIESSGVRAYFECGPWLASPQLLLHLAEEIRSFYKRFWNVPYGESWETVISDKELDGDEERPGYIDAFFNDCEYLREEAGECEATK